MLLFQSKHWYWQLCMSMLLWNWFHLVMWFLYYLPIWNTTWNCLLFYVHGVDIDCGMWMAVAVHTWLLVDVDDQLNTSEQQPGMSKNETFGKTGSKVSHFKASYLTRWTIYDCFSTVVVSLDVIQIQTRNKSNDYFESLRYRQNVRHIAHYHNRKYIRTCTRCSENHRNTCAENRKIHGLKFDTL